MRKTRTVITLFFFYLNNFLPLLDHLTFYELGAEKATTVNNIRITMFKIDVCECIKKKKKLTLALLSLLLCVLLLFSGRLYCNRVCVCIRVCVRVR